MITRACFLAFLTVLGALAGPLTQGERDRALSELWSTRKAFVDSIRGLSHDQWTYKPAPDRWSIEECAEHVALAEDSLFQLVTGKILKSPAQPPRDRAANSKLDEKVLSGVADRSTKAKAPENLEPSGRFSTPAEAIAAFQKSRDRTIDFIRETKQDLRAHRMKNPALGDLDAYQWILLIGAHTTRHTKQIQEIKALPGFPRN